MTQRTRLNATRLFYWTYAAAAWIGGFALQQWGTRWFGLHLPTVPWGMAAILRVISAFVAALGCFAAAIARLDDGWARRRMRAPFLAANAIVLVIFIAQSHAIWDATAAEYAAEFLFVVVLFGVLLGDEESDATSAGYRARWLGGVVPANASTRQLRSRYEEQIRQAAGQEERNRLARELHDSIKQQLFVIQTAAATVQARWEQDQPGARTALQQVRTSARDAMTEMEVMLDQLRAAPLEKVGVAEALKKQCEALGLRTGATVSCEVGELPAVNRLAPGAYQAIFRVAQEALTNIARHARASEVRVTLSATDNQVQLVVEDNGTGFNPDGAAQGMGLANMRERAEEFGGDVVVHGASGQGTRVTLVIPCLPVALAAPNYRLQAQIWAVMLFIQVALGSWKPDILMLAIVPAGFLARALGRLRQERRDGRR